MAATPGVLYIGGYHVQGGNPGLNSVADGLLNTNVRYLLDREVLRIVPDDPSTGNPTAASLSCWPWYDQNAGSTTHVVASSTTTTVTVSPSPGWTVNQWAGRVMSVTNTAPIPGVGFAQRITITSNTADTVTFAATTAPTVGATFFLGLGRMTDYHVVAGWLVTSEIGNPSTRGGSSVAAGGNGVGPDATLIRRLFEDVYNEAPYFHLWKHPTPLTAYSGWADSPNDSGRASFLLELARVNDAATARGNTIVWGEAIIDLSAADLEAAGANPLIALAYEARLREVIAWIRSSAVTNNASLRIVLVSHDSRLWSTTSPLGASFFRSVHATIAADTEGVGIVDMEGARIGAQVVNTDTPATEVKYYAQEEYLWMGEEIARVIRRLQLGIPNAVEGGLPTFLMLGDSIFVGEAVVTWTETLNSDSISGPTTGTLLRPSNQLILNRGTSVLEVYLPHTNSNTSGTVRATAGPDLSIMAELGLLYPDGFALLKRASDGSALATEAAAYTGEGASGGRWIKGAAEHYPELQADRDTAASYINNTLGKQMDIVGAFVSLGHNDQSMTGGGEAFDAALPQFCRDLWADFSTRTSGRNFPIAWRQPQLDAAGVNATRIVEVRDALEAQAERETQFVVVDVDDLERDKDDDLHETPETALVTGRRLVTALRSKAI